MKSPSMNHGEIAPWFQKGVYRYDHDNIGQFVTC